MPVPPFHLAFPVCDLEETRTFYTELLGCKQGRETKLWLDLDFFGHQIVAHLRPQEAVSQITGNVDGDKVPVPHFGAVLEWNIWQALADKLARAGVEFILTPRIRFQDKPGEQGTFFIRDPSGHALEFKTFRDMANLFSVT
jgi:extradiol dioxygenase family protein